METVKIERLGRAGDGLAGAIRVPLALPGEVWRVAPEGPVLETASPQRVAAPCPHYGVCGGCVLQHASDGFVADWKRETVMRALAARGIEAPVAATLTSPPQSRRRAVFAGRRSRGAVLLGFHGRRSEAVIDTPGCLVIRPEISAARPALAALTRLGATEGDAVRLTVTWGPAGLDVDLAGGRTLGSGLLAQAAALAEAADWARLTWAGAPVALRRPPVQPMGRAQVVPPPGGFLQATAAGQAALVEGVEAATTGARRIADLYAGCGTFTLPLAARAEVRAVEGSGEAVAALTAAWRRTPGLRKVAAEERDLARRPLLAADLAGIEAVVIDPPRSGAEAQTRALAASKVRRIASVSCDPATFARDARILLDGGFRLAGVTPVDQFRWSGHVELVAAFAR